MYPGIQDTGAGIAAAGVRSPGLMDLLVTANELYKDLTYGKRNRDRMEKDAENLFNMAGFYAPQYAQERRAEEMFPYSIAQTKAATEQLQADTRHRDTATESLRQLLQWSQEQNKNVPFDVFKVTEPLRNAEKLQGAADNAAMNRLMYQITQQAAEDRMTRGMEQDFILKRDQIQGKMARDLENLRRGPILANLDDNTKNVLAVASRMADSNPEIADLLQKYQYYTYFPTEENLRSRQEVENVLRQKVQEQLRFAHQPPGSTEWDGKTPTIDAILNFLKAPIYQYSNSYSIPSNRTLTEEQQKQLNARPPLQNKSPSFEFVPLP